MRKLLNAYPSSSVSTRLTEAVRPSDLQHHARGACNCSGAGTLAVLPLVGGFREPRLSGALSQVRSLSTKLNRSPAELLAEVKKVEELRRAGCTLRPRLNSTSVERYGRASVRVATLAGAVADLVNSLLA